MANCLINFKLIFSPSKLIINLINGKGLKLNIEGSICIRDYIIYKDSCNFYKLIGIISLDISKVIIFFKNFDKNEWYIFNNNDVNYCTFNYAISIDTPYFLFYSAKANN